MSSSEQGPLTFIQTPHELCTVTQGTTGIMSVICDASRSLFECLPLELAT